MHLFRTFHAPFLWLRMCFLVVHREIPFTMKYFCYCLYSGNWWPIVYHIPVKLVSKIFWNVNLWQSCIVVVLLNNKACYLVYFSRPIDSLGGRCGGLMVNALVSRSSSLGSSPGQGHCSVHSLLSPVKKAASILYCQTNSWIWLTCSHPCYHTIQTLCCFIWGYNGAICHTQLIAWE